MSEREFWGLLPVFPPTRDGNAETFAIQGGTMPRKGDVHVMPAPEDRWRVEVEGSTRAHSVHDTQAAATGAARKVARSKKSELLVHGRNGQIQDRSTYGHDPVETKG